MLDLSDFATSSQLIGYALLEWKHQRCDMAGVSVFRLPTEIVCHLPNLRGAIGDNPSWNSQGLNVSTDLSILGLAYGKRSILEIDAPSRMIGAIDLPKTAYHKLILISKYRDNSILRDEVVAN